MTPTQYHLLQRTVEYLRPIKTEIGLTMFKRLHETVPEAELDIDSRWRACTSMLEVVLSPQLSSKLMVPITSSDAMEIPPGLTNVTNGVVKLGLGPQHLPVLNSAFLWSLKQNLGGKFDSEMEEAWLVAFDLVGAALRATASEPAHSVPPQDRGKPIGEAAQGQLRELFHE